MDLLKEKTSAERFVLMLQLIEEQLEAMRCGIRYQNPDMSEEEVEKCLKERIRAVYSGKPQHKDF